MKDPRPSVTSHEGREENASILIWSASLSSCGSKKKLAVALTYAGIGGTAALLAAASATAQQTTATEPLGTITIEVTGSSIERIEGENALPVQVITREDIDKSGATTVKEILNLISANNSFGSITLAQAVGSNTFSQQTASLRGLGGAATLVLVNGKRLGAFAGGSTGTEGVNLAAIPFSAIERVEVLTDGASAIYGSDAVAGVINFIMRQDYQGLEGELWGGTPTQGSHGRQWQVSATGGWGNLDKDRYNAFVSLNYNEQRPLYDIDRSFSNTAYIPYIGLMQTSANTFPGYISTGGIGSLTFPNCAPNIVVGNRCRYDSNSQPGVESIPETKQWNFFGSGRYQINNDWQAYVTGLYSWLQNTIQVQPVPISDDEPTPTTPTGTAQILILPSSPYYPSQAAINAGVNGQPLNVRWRCYPCGDRITQDTLNAWQIVAGAKGTQWNWNFDLSLQYSQNTVSEDAQNGFPLYSKILPLLNSGDIDLLSASLPSDQVAALHGTDFSGPLFHGKLYQYGLDLKASSDIYQLPAGPLALAVGLHTENQKWTQNYSPVLQTGDLAGYGANPLNIDNSRSVWAVFGEVNIPVTEKLEVDGQIRYDHYSDSGNTTNPKVSMRWQPAHWLLLRASYDTGYLAPTLYELHEPESQGFSPTVSDPLRCPNPNAPGAENNPDCNTQYSVTLGGNPNLKPQLSSQWQVGGILEPVAGVSLGLDYFALNLSEVLSTSGVDIGTILNPQFYSQYAYLVTRQANCPGGQPCPITAIDQRFLNFGKERIQGFDISGQFITPATPIGRFKLTVQGTYYTRYDFRNSDGTYSSLISNAFGSAITGIIPRWKSYIPLTWDYGPWSLTLANSYQSAYVDFQTDANGNTREVGALTVWDIQGKYTGLKNWTFTIGCKNLLNRNPPLTNDPNNFQTGDDPGYWDGRQQFVYASIKYAWQP
jgi:iron complex outermembrane recepter protein